MDFATNIEFAASLDATKQQRPFGSEPVVASAEILDLIIS
jgi:hypothetical protein